MRSEGANGVLTERTGTSYMFGTTIIRIEKYDKIQMDELSKKLFNRIKLQNNEFFAYVLNMMSGICAPLLATQD